jgi:hypothetical protein
MQNSRKGEGQQKIGHKEDKAQPEILLAEENPIPARICKQQHGRESQRD